MPRLRSVAVLFLAWFGIARAAMAQEADGPCACNVTPAACDASCACDPECAYDWSQDECADPLAGCQEEVEPTEELLDALEAADEPEPDEAPTDPWEDMRPGTLACAEGAVAVEGVCVDAPRDDAGGGCAVGGPVGRHLPALGVGLLALAALVLLRRLGLSPLLVLAVFFLACGAADTPRTADLAAWDEAIDAGPPAGAAGAYLDVFAADLVANEGAVHVPAFHAAVTLTDHLEPAAVFALAVAPDQGVEVRRAPLASGCGDRLVAGASDGELVGYAASGPGAARALLVELTAPDGCGFRYETDPEAIAAYAADGWTESGSIGFVWPPGWGGPTGETAPDGLAYAPACRHTRRSPLILFSSDPGEEIARIAAVCPGEIVVGASGETSPPEAYWNPIWQEAGIHTGFRVSGDKLRTLLDQKGVEQTAAYLRAKLKKSAADTVLYDYILVDALGDGAPWRDGEPGNRRLRMLLMRLPKRAVIAYLGTGLTVDDGGAEALAARRRLVRALYRRGRVMALSVPMKTRDVMARAGAASAAVRRASLRLHESVRKLGVRNVNRRAITLLGLTVADAPSPWLEGTTRDLTSLRRQARAIRLGGGATGRQRGIGYDFDWQAQLVPPAGAGYTFAELVSALATQVSCWRSIGGGCGIDEPDPNFSCAFAPRTAPIVVFYGSMKDGDNNQREDLTYQFYDPGLDVVFTGGGGTIWSRNAPRNPGEPGTGEFKDYHDHCLRLAYHIGTGEFASCVRRRHDLKDDEGEPVGNPCEKAGIRVEGGTGTDDVVELFRRKLDLGWDYIAFDEIKSVDVKTETKGELVHINFKNGGRDQLALAEALEKLAALGPADDPYDKRLIAFFVPHTSSDGPPPSLPDYKDFLRSCRDHCRTVMVELYSATSEVEARGGADNFEAYARAIAALGIDGMNDVMTAIIAVGNDPSQDWEKLDDGPCDISPWSGPWGMLTCPKLRGSGGLDAQLKAMHEGTHVRRWWGVGFYKIGAVRSKSLYWTKEDFVQFLVQHLRWWATHDRP